MFHMFRRHSLFNTLLIVSVTFFLSLAATYVLADWVDPPGGPVSCDESIDTDPVTPGIQPASGCAPPINVSNNSQWKIGSLMVQGSLSSTKINVISPANLLT